VGSFSAIYLAKNGWAMTKILILLNSNKIYHGFTIHRPISFQNWNSFKFIWHYFFLFTIFIC